MGKGWLLGRAGVAAMAAVAGAALLVPRSGVQLAGETTWAPPPAAYSEGSSLNVPVTASDGTVLRADVYYPTPLCVSSCGSKPASYPGAFPVLLEQTPYGKQNVEQSGGTFATSVSALVGQGYVVVISDVRGTGTSGGTWGLLDPVQATDGATLARWAADDPAGSANAGGISAAVPGLVVDGNVGLFGESYMGINEFLTVQALDADGGPNPVKAMFPIIAGNDIYRDIVTQGGLFNIEFSAAYLALLDGLGTADPAFDPFEAQYVDAQHGGPQPGALAQQIADFPETAVGHAGQVSQYDIPTVENVETGGDEAYDAHEGLGVSGYWAQRNPVNVLQQLVHDHIATFLVGGWSDLFQRGELMNYTGLQNEWFNQFAGGRQAVTAPMSPNQPTTPMFQLLMGPWTHLTAGSGSDLTTLELEWFASWMGGPSHQATTPLSTTATPLHLFQMGSGAWNAQQHTGAWYDTADWPVTDGSGGYAATKLYLGPSTSTGGAASGLESGTSPALSDNQGTLSTTAPSLPTGADTVLYTGASSPCDLNSDQWGAGAMLSGQAGGGYTLAWPCDQNEITFGAGPGAL
ncbi:MAG: CocE/NonD family hydrolase, partial [Acidimicrobiales bacterium]